MRTSMAFRAGRRPTALGLGLAVVIAAGLVACAPPSDDEADSRTLIMPVETLQLAKTELWKPGGYAPEAWTVMATQSPLFYFGPSGEAVPALGVSYEVSDDRMSIDVRLREGVVFDDGTPMTAQGVADFLNFVISLDSFWPAVKKIGARFEATGEYSLRMTATTRFFHPDYFYADAIRLLFATAVLSPAVVDHPELATESSMGIGPYVEAEWEPEVSATFVRNPDFWDPDRYPFDTVVFRAIDDPTARLNALKSGQINVSPVGDLEAAEIESEGFRIFENSTAINTLIIRNPEESTAVPLRDVRVRQAISYALDRESIVETIQLGFGGVSSQAFIEGQPQYVEGGDDRYPYDPEQARELMAEAGYGDGFDLTLPLVSNDPLGPVLVQSLGDIGIRLTIEPLPDAAAMFGALFNADVPINLYTRMNSYNVLRLLDEQFGDGMSFFDPNPDISALLERVRFGDAEDSAEASRELGEKVLEECWYIPITRPSNLWAAAPGIEVELTNVVLPKFYDFAVAD